MGIRLPISICGMGRFATRRILPALMQCTEFELVAVVDRSGRDDHLPSSARLFTSLDDFLKEKPSGSVYIASPNFLHAQHSIQCLSSGLHVLCEKPMATNSIDCQSMIHVAREHNLQLWVGHMLRYSPALELAYQWVKKGLIGELRSVSTIFHYELAECGRPWAFRSGHFGGGVLMDAGIHCVDVIRNFAAGPITVVSANLDCDLHEDGVERKAQCYFRAGSVDCQVALDSGAPYRTSLKVFGSKGAVVVDNFAATWGEVSVDLYSPHSSGPVKRKVVDVSVIYIEQLRAFAKAVSNLGFAALQDTSAAENVKLIEELYSIS